MALTKVSYSMITGAPVNVLDFGAIGDGITDDTTAVTAAITAAAASGQQLYMPEGTYLLSSWTALTVTGKISIVGEGIGKTIITGVGNTQNFINIQNGVVLRNLTIGSFDKIVFGRPATGATSPVDEMTFTGVRFTDANSALFMQGLLADNLQSGVQQLNIQGCQFDNLDNYGLAMTMKRCDNCVIDGNSFTDLGNDSTIIGVIFGLDSIVPATRKFVSITNNYVNGVSSTGVSSGIETQAFMVHEADACYIAGNVIKNMTASNTDDCEAIYIRDVRNAIVTNNIISSIQTTTACIDVKEDCLYAQITDNVINNTDYASFDGASGIVCFVGNVVISRNRITNVGGYGINVVAVGVTGADASVMQENWISGVGAFAGIFALIGNGGSISNNVISDIKANYTSNNAFGSLAGYDTTPSGIFFIGKTATPNLQMCDNRIAVNVSVAHVSSYGFNCNAVASLNNVTMMDNVIRATTKRYYGNVAGGTEAHSVGSFNVEQLTTGQEGFLRFNDGANSGGVSYDHLTNVLCLRQDDNSAKVFVDDNITIVGLGNGLVLTSPDGLTTKTVTIDNSGNLTLL